MKINKIKDWFSDRWIIIWGLITILFVLYFMFGCQSETKSLLDPKQKVTRLELQSEIDFLLQQTQARIEDLDKQDAIRNMILNQAIVIAQTGTVNPIGVMTSILAILGIFSTADDIRLRKKLKKTLTYEPIKNGSSN